MFAADAALAEVSGCLYLGCISAFFGASLALVLVHGAELKPWRTPVLAASILLAACIAVATGLVVREAAFQSLPERERDALLFQLGLQGFSSLSVAVLLAGAWILWERDTARLLPWSLVAHRSRSLSAVIRAIPWLWLGAGLVAMILISIGLFSWFEARPAPELKPWLDAFRANPAVPLLFLLPAVVFEEVMFRGCFQGWLRRVLRPYDPDGWAAVVVPAVVWALGHAGQVEPDFPKLAQIFGFGIVLGATAARHGLEAAFFLHLGFNLATFLPIFPPEAT